MQPPPSPAPVYPAPGSAPWEDPSRGAPRSREEWQWRHDRSGRLLRLAAQCLPGAVGGAAGLDELAAEHASATCPAALPRYTELPAAERARDAAAQAARLHEVRAAAQRVLAATGPLPI